MITLAADFGGRRIKLGLVRDGQVAARQVLPANADQPLEARLEAVAEGLKTLCGELGLATADCGGVGFAYPSIIDTRQARILDHFGKFGDASRLDLRAWAKNTLGLPLAIDNDARMALIGEWRYGAGRGCDNLAVMTLGTGLGTSAVIEGRVLRGAHGQAGILSGHLTVRYGGRPCVCGNIGCAESEASTWMLERLAAEREDFAGSALKAEPVLDYAAVFRLAAAGDPCAQALRQHSLQVWSATAVNLVHAYDPEKIVLCGGIMASAAVIVPAVQEYVARHAHTPWGKVEVAASVLGDEAALLACEWLWQEQP
ncbi:MAG TPA: ROK family protein [Clostridia bacterium]|nr:ROK family protein [Clostridia bacterium]